MYVVKQADEGDLGVVSEALLNEQLSDVGNARRLLTLHGKDLRYCFQRRQWFIWNGKYFEPDLLGKIIQKAKEVPHQLLINAARAETSERRKELAIFAVRQEAEQRIMAMVRLARDEFGIATTADEFDSDPFLLNVMNGTVDLNTGQLLLHNRNDLMAKMAPVSYDPNARCPVWERYLEDTTGGDQELKSFLRRATGYSITGDTREEKIFFTIGPTNTGKTTFMESVKATLGPYAVTADMQSFLRQRLDGGPRNDLARLAGSRFVSSVESDDGRKLAEGLVKMLTGGDRVVARAMYKELFEYTPTFKIWLGTNSPPRVRDDDDAVWRRILKIPFDQQVPEDRRDPQVKIILKHSPESQAAILAWAVRGCLEWQERGLDPPASVLASTKAYREENDPLTEFLEERCVLTSQAWVANADLHPTYREWAKQTGKTPLSQKAIAQRLKQRGCEPKKSGERRGWQGLGLLKEG